MSCVSLSRRRSLSCPAGAVVACCFHLGQVRDLKPGFCGVVLFHHGNTVVFFHSFTLYQHASASPFLPRCPSPKGKDWAQDLVTFSRPNPLVSGVPLRL